MKRKQLAPHIHANQPASERYMYVLLAMLPALIGGVFYNGIRVLVLLAVSCTVFFFSDFLSSQTLYPDHVSHVDYSSLVSGTMLALLVPASASIWVVAIAALFGSLLVKQAFGGAGTNIFNPAFAARAFLQIAFPAQMVASELPQEHFWDWMSLLTGKSAGNEVFSVGSVELLDIFSGRLTGMIGTTSLVLLAMGALILTERKLFRFEAPLTYMAVIALGYVPFFWSSAGVTAFLLWMVQGGIPFVAIFALNDCTTTPLGPCARMIFGGVTGFLTLILYRFGNGVMAMVYPILMMNLMTPIFDYYFRPRAFSKSHWFKEVEK